MTRMQTTRRRTLRALGLGFAWLASAGAGLLRTGQALAATWNKQGFEAKSVAEVLKNLGAAPLTESRDILITAPDIAENGAEVPVTVTSRIANTRSLSLIAEKNPFPLVATFDFEAGIEATVSIRIKMAESSRLRCVVRADGRFFTAAREIKVTLGGCGV
ncbi:MAG: thiosulfate oxidation carrier protein SoxY [Burkholderiales bacterium]